MGGTERQISVKFETKAISRTLSIKKKKKTPHTERRRRSKSVLAFLVLGALLLGPGQQGLQNGTLSQKQSQAWSCMPVMPAYEKRREELKVIFATKRAQEQFKWHYPQKSPLPKNRTATQEENYENSQIVMKEKLREQMSDSSEFRRQLGPKTVILREERW